MILVQLINKDIFK